MTTYRVTWTIDTEGEDAQEAAEKAFEVMQGLSYPTTHFEVTDPAGTAEEVQVLTDEPVVYDDVRVIDRYTVFLQPSHPDPGVRRSFLGCAVGGRGFSEWGEVDFDDWGHMGEKLTLDDLDEETRSHILKRAKEV